MYVTNRTLDTDAITRQFVLQEVKDILDPILSIVKLLASFIPEIGTEVKLGVAVVKAGLDVATLATQTGIDFQYDDIYIHGSNGKL